MPSDRDVWLATAAGKQFHPYRPAPDEVDLYDIAFALSNKPRFYGMTGYSVAQHCLEVSARVPPEDALWGLLHDASEAWLPDVSRVLKGQLFVLLDGRFFEFATIENAILRTVAARFALPWPMPASIKTADNRALVTEKRDLFGPDWPWCGSVDAEPYPDRIRTRPPTIVRRVFLSQFAQLDSRRPLCAPKPAQNP